MVTVAIDFYCQIDSGTILLAHLDNWRRVGTSAKKIVHYNPHNWVDLGKVFARIKNRNCAIIQQPQQHVTNGYWHSISSIEAIWKCHIQHLWMIEGDRIRTPPTRHDDQQISNDSDQRRLDPDWRNNPKTNNWERCGHGGSMWGKQCLWWNVMKDNTCCLHGCNLAVGVQSEREKTEQWNFGVTKYTARLEESNRKNNKKVGMWGGAFGPDYWQDRQNARSTYSQWRDAMATSARCKSIRKL